jgi:hypothetical protein
VQGWEEHQSKYLTVLATALWVAVGAAYGLWAEGWDVEMSLRFAGDRTTRCSFMPSLELTVLLSRPLSDVCLCVASLAPRLAVATVAAAGLPVPVCEEADGYPDCQLGTSRALFTGT